jgi:hypothetical protein
MKITRDKHIVTVEIEDSDINLKPGQNIQSEKEFLADCMLSGMQLLLDEKEKLGISGVLANTGIICDEETEKKLQNAAADLSEKWEILPGGQ